MNDDTRADDDVATMVKMMDYFGIKHETHIFRTTEREPLMGWRLTSRINQILGKCIETEENSLFVFYYVGHGQIFNGELHLGSNVQAAVPWPDIKHHLAKNLDDMRKIDVLAILDCCYSGAATRSQGQRTMQVLAACGPTETASARGQKISFTQRVFRAAGTFWTQGSVTTAALFQEIQKDDDKREKTQRKKNMPLSPKAVMETLGGIRPIKLVFASTERPTSSSSPQSLSLSPTSPPDRKATAKHVVVRLTLKGEGDEVEVFKRAVKDLPDAMKVEVIDAFETDSSIFLILHMSWECWALWTMVAKLEFIGVTRGPSLHRRQLMELPVRGFGENRPPTKP